MPDEEAARIPAAYEAHVRELAPALPTPARRLVRETSLHDGLMRSVSHEGDKLDLLFRAGDQQTGFFDAQLRYTAVQVTPASEQFLRAIVGNRDVELLYDEFDSAGDGKQWVHRLLFWPYHEVSIQFGAFDLEVTPAAGRFDEGRDGNCCEQMRRQMQHTCEAHPDLSDCPDSLIVRLGEPGAFGLRVHDGGGSSIRIRYCPWCGADLWFSSPASRNVFLLWHVHRFEDGRDDEKLIGVYSSEQDAVDAQNRLSKEAGFRDHSDGFEISAYRLGKDHWTEGFVTVD